MAYQLRKLSRTNREMAAAIGVAAAGVALFEAALIPGMVIGAAAVLAPKYLPKLRRRLQPLLGATAGQHVTPAVPPAKKRPDVKTPLTATAGLGIKQAALKTITFRIIVTTVDFTANFVVLGELATAAGLSAVTLVAGPIFYFVHETAWNHSGPSVARHIGRWGIAVEHPALPSDAEAPAARPGFRVSRALAKTITFRTFATVMDFTANFVVTGELATAAKLSAIGFVIGPFIYLGHEKAWDYYGPPTSRNYIGQQKLLGAPNTDARKVLLVRG